MATLTVTKASRAGATRNPVAAAGGGDDFPNDGRTVFIVNNAGGAACECSFALGVDPHSGEPTQSTSATAISVAASDEDVIGPFPVNKFGSSVAVTYNQVTSVTVEPVSIA
jgi:hypothetical protein